MKPGPKRSTGRYDTRAELCAAVWELYGNTGMSIAQVARSCRCGYGVAWQIIDKKEGYPDVRAVVEQAPG